MLCLPLPMFHGWLVQIDLDRVNEQAQPIVERYQREAFQAIAAHFSRRQEMALEKAVDERRRLEKTYFARYPRDMQIRSLALHGEPYWYIARKVDCHPGTVSAAVRRMIEWTVMDARRLEIARQGMRPYWAHLRKYRDQLTLF